MNLLRIDDISINTDLEKLRKIVSMTRSQYPGCMVMLGVSPLVHEMTGDRTTEMARERVFPKILNAYSDHRVFFDVKKAGLPDLSSFSEFSPVIASHGLIHVDHRLLSRECQELSILVSCSLTTSTVFIPPFNHWNHDTESICNEHKIVLVKFEDGWEHLLYLKSKVRPEGNYYIHTHDLGIEQFKELIS